MEKWTNDNIPVAGETFREFVKKLYQRNQLVKGEFTFGMGEPPVDLKKITCPLLLLAAKGDHPSAAFADDGDARLRGVERHEGHGDRSRPRRARGEVPKATSSSGRGDEVGRRSFDGTEIMTVNNDQIAYAAAPGGTPTGIGPDPKPCTRFHWKTMSSIEESEG